MKTTWKLGSLISLLCLSGALLAPAMAQAVAQDTPSTFEVKVQQNTPFRVTADRIAHNQMGLIVLESDGEVVAAIQQHQIVYVVNISETASRRFEIQTYDNSTYQIPGESLVPEQNGMIRVDGPNGTMGYISNSQLRYVVAVEARQ
ncbi:MAG: hypothetical protein V3T25_04860 [Gemmatimonadota bacterium]